MKGLACFLTAVATDSSTPKLEAWALLLNHLSTASSSAASASYKALSTKGVSFVYSFLVPTKCSMPASKASCFASSFAAALKYLHFFTVYSARDLEQLPKTASTKSFILISSPSIASLLRAYLAMSLLEAFSSSISLSEMIIFCSGVKHMSESFSVTSSVSSAAAFFGESTLSLSFFLFSLFSFLSDFSFFFLLLSFLAVSASSCSPSSSLSLSCLLILSTAFFFVDLFFGGFLMMNVFSLWRGSTSDTWPQALQVRVMKSFLSTSITVSGLPQE
mmetsp:Transcript_13746/g.38723  ORF Transcript_13746/g.38723 Transcript_13746/m.38723 type:complete len:275 (-) Transcript_13746:1000-1824(-)